MLKPKEDNDKMLKTLRDIVSSSPNNRTCFDCGQKGVTYVNTTIGTFVCSTCSGILRGLTPPHRIKSISMATFTPDELEFVRMHGNDECGKTWLGLWDSKRTLKQDHRDFMVDKYERKRYYLEPASPLKSINTQSTVTTFPQQQLQPQIQQNQTTATMNGMNQQLSDFTVLKSIQLTSPSANNRQHRTHHNHSQNENGSNFFPSATTAANHLNNGSSNEFVADFRKANIYNSNNSLNSTGSGGGNSGHQVNGKIPTNETSNSHNGDLNANFADFENNKIYNAAEEYYKNNNNNSSMNSPSGGSVQWNIWQQFQHLPSNNILNNHHNYHPEQFRWSLPMSTSSLSNNSLNSSSNGTFTSNSSLNSTPSADRYAALKDLDEQLREAKIVTPVEPQQPQHHQQQQKQNPPANPFKNPFQTVPMSMQQPHQQQSNQNWTFSDIQSNNFSGFGSPPLGTNGFYYTNNMTNGMITQPSPFSGKVVFGNPFMSNGTAATTNNNPFL